MTREKLNLTFDGPSGQRIDAWLSSVLEEMSRSYIRRLIDNGLVLLNGSPVKASTKLQGGENVDVTVPPPEPIALEPEEIPLDVLFEDSSIIAINKPAGMVVHPAPGHHDGTLVNALLAHCADLSGIGGATRPGIVHRLDVGTTGVILVAKNDQAHRSLSDQFRHRTTKKLYMALVFGRLKEQEGEVDLPIGRDRKERTKISPNSDALRDARTSWWVERQWQEFSLLRIRIHTGRTHQIRVHMAHLQHPLVGDDLYAGRRWRGVQDQQMGRKARLFGRPALHAWQLSFDHPADGRRMTVEAQPPRDMGVFMNMLGEPT